MLDHVTLTVADVAKAKAFYDTALAPLGIAAITAGPDEAAGDLSFAGYGANGRAFFWIGGGWGQSGHAHVALVAETHAAVDAFYAAAIAGGARDNGPPGIRAHYDPNYYAAFVLDPDGHNIEAVCRKPG